jgi:hypothetical protein
MNYAQLVVAINSHVEDSFSTTTVDTFIKQAEQRIYNSVQLPNLRKNMTGTVASGNKYLTCPSDWLATFSLAIVTAAGDYEFLLNKDVNFIREAYPNPSTTGTPAHYAQFDDTTFLLGPTPDASYTTELHYFYLPESIVTASTTWLGDNFDSTLLYGALLEAYTFMKGEPEVVAMYQKRYDEALMLLKQLGDGKDRRDAYRSGQLRVGIS